MSDVSEKVMPSKPEIASWLTGMHTEQLRLLKEQSKHVAKISTITDADLLAAADVNKDGDVNAKDLTHLAKYVAKIITEL